MANKWISVQGTFETSGQTLIAAGGSFKDAQGTDALLEGVFISDEYFGGGTISTKIKFDGPSGPLGTSAAGLVLAYDPLSRSLITVQLGGWAMASIQSFNGVTWDFHSFTGLAQQLKTNQIYELKVKTAGSRIEVFLDDVHANTTILPQQLQLAQAGVWIRSGVSVRFSDFSVDTSKPEMFVVMEFSDQFDALYTDVIQKVGQKAGYEVIRADEMSGSNLIISDIVRQLNQSSLVVAEISSRNPNVFWELGYAQAMKKSLIIIARDKTDLPFDVAGFRILFYRDTIGGKNKIEGEFATHLAAIAAK